MKICLVVAPQNKDGILDRIAHEVGAGFEEAIYHYGTTNIPKADHYFVTHYSLVPAVIEQINPDINLVTCFFTHVKGNLYPYVEAFNLCHSIICESPEGIDILSDVGVQRDLLHFVPEGGDNIAFNPHARTLEGSILICGTNYSGERKNPEFIREVVKLLPHRKFLFIGKGWETITEGRHSFNIPYNLYPNEFSFCSVYLSCSKLEGGGPNSLIEAMHSNLVPVVSDTGNARQYIIDGYNGFIFGKEASPKEVADLIEEAYKIKPQDTIPYNDIWQTVRNYTWQNYSLQMREIILNDYSKTASQGLDGITSDT